MNHSIMEMSHSVSNLLPIHTITCDNQDGILFDISTPTFAFDVGFC